MARRQLKLVGPQSGPLRVISGHQSVHWRMSALPPEADMLHRPHRCLLSANNRPHDCADSLCTFSTADDQVGQSG